ncbi:MAG: hypothetical protein ABEJ65_06470 [bacterium]
MSKAKRSSVAVFVVFLAVFFTLALGNTGKKPSDSKHPYLEQPVTVTIENVSGLTGNVEKTIGIKYMSRDEVFILRREGEPSGGDYSRMSDSVRKKILPFFKRRRFERIMDVDITNCGPRESQDAGYRKLTLDTTYKKVVFRLKPRCEAPSIINSFLQAM